MYFLLFLFRDFHFSKIYFCKQTDKKIHNEFDLSCLGLNLLIGQIYGAFIIQKKNFHQHLQVKMFVDNNKHRQCRKILLTQSSN